MAKYITCFLLLITAPLLARNHYAGYSGAPGSNGTCANSCHSQYSFPPSVNITGFPDQYTPGREYEISIIHTGGSAINQFNASIRIGTGEEIAGNLTPGFNTEIYRTPGEMEGARWEIPDSDSGNFLWTAPDPGMGIVTLYCAGLQGNRAYGTDVRLILVSEDITAEVEYILGSPMEFSLEQNYPNPFNDRTNVEFTVAKTGPVEFIITNILGQVLYFWSHDYAQPGMVTIHWDGYDLNGRIQPSGVYFYRLKTPEITMTKKMMILR